MSRKEELLREQFARSQRLTAPASADDDEIDHWDGLREYQAFKPVDTRQLRLRLRPAAPPWDQVKYQYLLHMPEDDRGTFLCLVFTVLVVVIKGKHLQPISSAVGRERCVTLWQFDPKRFDKPSDPAAPFIESLEIRLETRGMVVDEVVAEIAAAAVGLPE